MSGLWVFVCGPSGAGKDSVMNWAAEQLAANQNIIFARRLVTRAAHPGSDHDPVTADKFADLIGSDGLVWRWQAHGFQYGIDAHYGAEVAAGRVVVVNGSREHASGLDKSEKIRVVQIMAEPDQLAHRLEKRGRDLPHEVERRRVRNTLFADLRTDLTIVNQGALADAGQLLADYLLTAQSSS